MDVFIVINYILSRLGSRSDVSHLAEEHLVPSHIGCLSLVLAVPTPILTHFAFAHQS